VKTVVIEFNPETGGVNLQAQGVSGPLEVALILTHTLSVTLGKIGQPAEDAPSRKIIVPTVVPPREVRP
jgi:hypothetical protein